MDKLVFGVKNSLPRASALNFSKKNKKNLNLLLKF